ncbi:MAG: hypothetical protein JXA13_12405 [Anaerolineales bacterium]|nr:hypothetical protein [Anaerolineales bacterium]
MKSTWRVFGIVFCVLLSSITIVQAQEIRSEFFDETGHNLAGTFLDFYYQVEEPVLVYGYPVTEEFTSIDGKVVQYFQRARFEKNSLGGVKLTPLGLNSYLPGSGINAYNPLACRYFQASGRSVCYDFLVFYEKNGGASLFGNPISNFEYHDDLIVQYFENARLEWRPWMPEGQQVVVADLGRIYFDQLGEDPVYLEPVKPLNLNIVPETLSLKVRGFVWKAVTQPNDEQLIFVIVQNQNLTPVAGATGNVIVHWPDGRNESLNFVTDNNGIGILPLPIIGQPHGKVIYIDVQAAFPTATQVLTGVTSSSFRIWY